MTMKRNLSHHVRSLQIIPENCNDQFNSYGFNDYRPIVFVILSVEYLPIVYMGCIRMECLYVKGNERLYIYIEKI